MTTSPPVETPSPFAERFDPLGADFDDPFPAYAYARAHAPVFFSERIGAWVVTRYDDVRAALRAPELFASTNALRPLTVPCDAAMEILRTCYPMTEGSITLDGAAQRPFRARLNATLAPKRVAALEPELRRRADELVDAFAGAGRADLIADYGYPLALETIAHVAGLDRDALPVIRDGSIALSALTFARLDPDRQVAAARQLQAIQRVLLDHLEARRAEPRDDGLGAIAAALAPGVEPMDFMQTAQLLTVAVELVLPGHTTSVAMIGNGLVRLLEDRSRWERLVADPDLPPNAVEEVARFDNPVHGFLRVTTAPATVAGVELPAGSEVLLVYASANRDDALCERPDEFDIGRAPTHHLGFALGAHFCPGAPLGRLQVGIALGTLLRRLPGLRRDGDEPVRLRRDFTMRGPVELRVRW